MRTPLENMFASLDALLACQLTSEQRDFLLCAQTSGAHLSAKMGAVLRLALLSQAPLETPQTPSVAALDVTRLVHDAWVSLGALTEGLPVEWMLRVSPGVPRDLLGDAEMITSLLLNLGSNAGKHTRFGHVLCACDVVALTDDTAVLQFSVQDTGTGISAANLKRVFEPFAQVTADTVDRASVNSTGLGLAVAVRECEAAGGRLWAESEYGHGSTFFFTVKCGRPLSVAPTRPASCARACTTPDGLLDPAWSQRVALVCANSSFRAHLVADLDAFTVSVTDGAGARARAPVLANEASPICTIVNFTDLAAADRPAVLAALHTRGEPCLILAYPWEFADAKPFCREGDALRLKPLLDLGAAVRSCVRGSTSPPNDATADQALEPVVGSGADALPPNAAAATVHEPAPTAALGMTHAGAFRILIVDDLDMNRKILRTLCKGVASVVKKSHRTVVTWEEASDGLQAVLKASVSRPHLVLMDKEMPLLGGLDATRRIRQQEAAEQRPRCFICLVSAGDADADAEEAFAAGFDRILPKPLYRNDLQAVVVSLLASASSDQDDEEKRNSEEEDGLLPPDTLLSIAPTHNATV